MAPPSYFYHKESVMHKGSVLFCGIVSLVLISSQGAQAATIESRFAIHNDGSNICEVIGTSKTCYASENIPELKLVEHGKVNPSLVSTPGLTKELGAYNLIFVRDVIYDLHHAVTENNVIEVPFLASIRWVKKGIENGTLYTKGIVYIAMANDYSSDQEARLKVTTYSEVENYSDSKPIEKYMRMLNFSAVHSKALSDATTYFIETSAGPVLSAILSHAVGNYFQDHSASGPAVTQR